MDLLSLKQNGNKVPMKQVETGSPLFTTFLKKRKSPAILPGYSLIEYFLVQV